MPTTAGRTTITRDGQGQGGFLCPPGHPNHVYTVKHWDDGHGRRREADAHLSVDSAADTEWLPEDARERARRLIETAELVESELWVRNVYGYFRSMYVPEDGSRKVSDLISDREGTLPAERHAAVAMIREYFPDHEPRTDLIADSSYCYGAYACTKCEKPVQYEARHDALAPFGGSPVCPTDGGRHEWPARPETDDSV